MKSFYFLIILITVVYYYHTHRILFLYFFFWKFPNRLPFWKIPSSLPCTRGGTTRLTFVLRSILFYIVTEHYHPNTQCRIGLISEVIVISIVNPICPCFSHFFSQSYILSFFPKGFLRFYNNAYNNRATTITLQWVYNYFSHSTLKYSYNYSLILNTLNEFI